MVMAGISLIKKHENKLADMWQDTHYNGVDCFAKIVENIILITK